MKKKLGYLFLFLVIVVMYLPIIVLAVYSFTDSANIGTIHGFSLENYKTLFLKDELKSMIIGTIVLALISALLATILGTLGAIGTFYSKKLTAVSYTHLTLPTKA